MTLVQLSGMEVTAVPGNDRLTLTGAGGETIIADDDAYDYMSATYPVGTCFTTVTGVMTLNIFDDERRLAPRLITDLVVDADGSDCP